MKKNDKEITRLSLYEHLKFVKYFTCKKLFQKLILLFNNNKTKITFRSDKFKFNLHLYDFNPVIK